MSKGVNKVFLLGNVGKDPEIRTTPGGMTVANFTLATADRAKDASGTWVDKPEWHNLVCFDKLADTAKNYIKKAFCSSRAKSPIAPGMIKRPDRRDIGLKS